MGRRSLLTSLAALMASLTATACELIEVMKPAEVLFELDRTELRVGEDVEVRFKILSRNRGQRYWVTLLPEGTGFDDTTGRVEVLPGVESVRISASASGPHSVRVLSDRDGAVRMVAWRRVGVLPS